MPSQSSNEICCCYVLLILNRVRVKIVFDRKIASNNYTACSSGYKSNRNRNQQSKTIERINKQKHREKIITITKSPDSIFVRNNFLLCILYAIIRCMYTHLYMHIEYSFTFNFPVHASCCCACKPFITYYMRVCMCGVRVRVYSKTLRSKNKNKMKGAYQKMKRMHVFKEMNE